MTTGNAPTQDVLPRGGAAWIDPELQQQVEWREGDIIVSVPAKSGTTWMMNIVHQLRTGGDPGFKDIYIEVPWLEFVEGPEDTRERRLERFRSMTICGHGHSSRTKCYTIVCAFLCPQTREQIGNDGKVRDGILNARSNWSKHLESALSPVVG